MPTGVGLEVEINGEKPFGFNGGNVTPFDRGPFYRKNSGLLNQQQAQETQTTGPQKAARKSKKRANLSKSSTVKD